MITDIFTYCAILLCIVFMYRLCNRAMRRSSERSRRSERALEDERDALELRISERTIALVIAEEMRAEEADRVIQFGRLSQGLFHDLMNPLSSLSLYAEHMVENGVRPDETHDMVEKIIATSKRMNSFMASVKRCLERAGNVPQGQDAGADLRKEILIARDVLAYKARIARTEIHIEQSENIRLRIHPVRLHQLFLNLLSNAISACEAKSKQKEGYGSALMIEIDAKKIGQDLVMRIADTGCGFTPSQKEKAFKESFTGKEGGTGMGLSTVKRIVDELKGSISFTTQEGFGTTFTITVPLGASKPAL